MRGGYSYSMGMCILDLRFSEQYKEFSFLLLRASVNSDHVSWDHGCHKHNITNLQNV